MLAAVEAPTSLVTELMTTIADAVRAAGIVGAGGAGFPSHVKFASRVDTVIANGAECEPLLHCDKAVMRERTDSVLRGLCLLAEATGARRAVIALKRRYPEVVERVRAVTMARYPSVEIHELDNYYPAGDEQVLVNEVTGRVVPEGGIPLHVDVVVNNVVTLSQVAGAHDHGEPVTARPLTVGGEVARPLSCELPIGTPMASAIELAGGATVDAPVIVEGGPMMGRLVRDFDEPIGKRTSGVLVLDANHPLVQQKARALAHETRRARAACCQCRMCTDLCPRFNLGHSIQPHLAMRALLSEGLTEPVASHISAAWLCCLCGVCEAHACTQGLSPRKIFESLRSRLSAEGATNPHRRKDCQRHDFATLRRVPVDRLVARLGLSDYAHAASAVDLADRSVARVRLRLSQHIGASAAPLVAVGDQVERGQLIAEIPADKLSARLHASISGRVTAVDDREIRIERN